MSTKEMENIKNAYKSVLRQYSNTISNSIHKSQIENLNKSLIAFENMILDYKIRF